MSGKKKDGSVECICTVLLITYNHEPYFRTAIESVLEQKTNYKFKIHIFDDASSDGTSEIVREYAEKYPQLITAFIAESNQGAQANIWNAYKSVDTKYCALLETDDYWCDEDKLQLQIKALEENTDCSFCAHNTALKTLKETTREYADGSLWVTRRIFKLKKIIHYYDIDTIDIGGYIPHISSRLVRTEFLNLCKIKYKESILFDFNQYFYLLIEAPYYYINRVMSVYQKTGYGIHSAKQPLEVLNQELVLICDFNKETDFVIADKIFREYRLQMDHRIKLHYEYRYNTGCQKVLSEATLDSSNDKRNDLNYVIEHFYTDKPEMLRNQLIELNEDFEQAYNSREYKIGKLLITLPKMFLVVYRSCRDVGFRYTLNNIKKKIAKILKINKGKPQFELSGITANKGAEAVKIDVLQHRLDKNNFYFLCNAGIGDTMLVAGLKSALQEKYGGTVHLLIPPSHEFLMEMYNISEYTLTDFYNHDLYLISDKSPTPQKGHIFVAHPCVHRELSRFFAPIRDQISIKKFYPWFLEFLCLDKDTPLQLPLNIPQMSDEFRKKVEKIAAVNKIALICIEATSMLWLPEQFWIEKVNQLKDEGLTVISNAKDPQNTVPGSYYLKMELHEAVSLAYSCDSVYALRSGFCDAIYAKGKDLHVYYPRHSSLYIYSLNDLFNRRDIDETIYLV